MDVHKMLLYRWVEASIFDVADNVTAAPMGAVPYGKGPWQAVATSMHVHCALQQSPARCSELWGACLTGRSEMPTRCTQKRTLLTNERFQRPLIPHTPFQRPI